MNIAAPIVKKMDETEFDQRWDEIERAPERAPGDQAFGTLIAEATASGWTVREIAIRKKVGPAHVSRLLIFGRFLRLSPIGDKNKTLTEGAFRDRWHKTNEQWDEYRRFEEVARQLHITLLPAPEPPVEVADTQALISEIAKSTGLNPNQRISEIRCIVKEAKHANIIDKLRSGAVKVHAALAFIRHTTTEEQASATAADITKRGNKWHQDNHGGPRSNRPSSNARKASGSPSKKKTTPPKPSATPEEQALNRQQLIEEDKRRQREARERKAARKDMRRVEHPVVMYGVKLWPVDEKEKLVVGYYDYDQMFYAVHLFRDWLHVASIGVKNNDSLAAYMRERMKALIKFADNRLEGECQKELLGVCALFQKLADFLRDNPGGDCKWPRDIDMVLDGF